MHVRYRLNHRDTGSADLEDVMPYKEWRVVWRGRVPQVHSDAMLCGGLPLRQIVRSIPSVVERPAHSLPFASLLRQAAYSSVDLASARPLSLALALPFASLERTRSSAHMAHPTH